MRIESIVETTQQCHHIAKRAALLLLLIVCFSAAAGWAVPIPNNADSIILNSSYTVGEISVSVHPNGKDTALAAVLSNSETRIFRTTNSGVSWSLFEYTSGYRGDPIIAIAPNGVYHMAYIVDSTPTRNLWVARYSGGTWSATKVSSSGTLDKEHMWIDTKSGSSYQGRVHMAWRDGYKLNYAYDSTGTGQWSSIKVLNDTINYRDPQGANVQTGPNGEVYVAWGNRSGLEYNSHGFARSINGGASFSAQTNLVTGIQGPNNLTYDSSGLPVSPRMNGASSKFHGWPILTVNQQNGHIFAAWGNKGNPNCGNTGNLDVYFVKSENGGISWGNPFRATNSQSGDQWLPWISCDPVTGVMSVLYFHADSATPERINARLSVSTNGGTTWQDGVISDNYWIGQYPAGSDYIGLASLDKRVYPFWYGATGTITNGTGQDAYTSQLLLDTTSFTVAECCSGTRGDADLDGSNGDIADLTMISEYVNSCGVAPTCFKEADVNGDGIVNAADVTYMVNYLFITFVPPVSCN